MPAGNSPLIRGNFPVLSGGQLNIMVDWRIASKRARAQRHFPRIGADRQLSLPREMANSKNIGLLSTPNQVG
ncbi:hypothetical protein HI914_06737 [Erysiphe necator]|nr:hypothetical protein HI914_06737 [Erysiphe necator]